MADVEWFERPEPGSPTREDFPVVSFYRNAGGIYFNKVIAERYPITRVRIGLDKEDNLLIFEAHQGKNSYKLTHGTGENNVGGIFLNANPYAAEPWMLRRMGHKFHAIVDGSRVAVMLDYPLERLDPE